MKKLILLTCLSIMSSAFAVEGVFVPEFELPKGQILITEGFGIKAGQVQSLNVTIDENGIKSVVPYGKVMTSQDTLIMSTEVETVNTRGLLDVNCSSQYGKSEVKGSVVEVTRWSLLLKRSCPISKQQNRRGLSEGKSDFRIQRFSESGSDVILENDFGSYKIAQKLIRL